MKILLKRMPKCINRRKVDKFMSELGMTAFCNESCKQNKDSIKNEKHSEEKEEAKKQYLEKSIFIKKRGRTAGLFNEGTNTI